MSFTAFYRSFLKFQLPRCAGVFPVILGFSGLVSSVYAQDARRPQPSPEQSQPSQWEIIPQSKTAQEKLALKKVDLPPLPEDVEELDFRDFFVTPVGDRGLTLTERLRSLDGRRVRLVGYMVYEDLTRCNSCVTPRTLGGRPVPAWMEATVPGRMMLTSRPAAVSHFHYGLADDLPPQTVFVTVPDKIGQLVPYTPGPMVITGILSVGSHKEMDGRTSLVRLNLALPDELSATAQKSAPVVSSR